MLLTLGTWFSREDVFLPGHLVIGLVGLVKAIDILSRRVYQGFVCVVSVTSIIASTFSQRTLLITQPIKLKDGNAKPNILFQSCCITSVTKLFGSGWWHSLEANRSTVGVPKDLVIFR